MTSFLSARAREEEEVVGKWGQTEGRLRVGAKLTFEKGKSFPFEANQPNLFYDVRAAVILRTAVGYLAASVWAAPRPRSVLHTVINLILTVVAIEIEDQTHFTDEKDEFQTE